MHRVQLRATKVASKSSSQLSETVATVECAARASGGVN